MRPADRPEVLHPTVREVMRHYLEEMDRALPGRLEKLYLVGSVALGDYRPGVSDIDFLAVTAAHLDARELEQVAGVHARLPAAPHCDGIYIDGAALLRMPDVHPNVPHVLEGIFHASGPCGDLNPVLWLMLERAGIALRGPCAADLALRVDRQRVRRWNLGNLNDYWRPLAATLRRAVVGRSPSAPADADGVVWAVLGAPRLHYTLATNEVMSKSASAGYVVQHFPTWGELALQAAAWRSGADVSFTNADVAATAELVEAVVADAGRRWGAGDGGRAARGEPA